jgi:glycosyltransferase involved in cell wall biosynthesis
MPECSPSRLPGKLRILLVSNLCPPDFDGGYELRAFQIAQALQERGHLLDLATSQYRPDYGGERNDPSWVHRIFKFVPVSRSKTVWRYVDRIPKRIACTTVAVSNLPAMEAFLAGREYDLAYVFGVQRISLATIAPLVRRKVPILWHAGDNYLADHLYHWPRSLFGYSASLNLFAGKWYRLEKRLDYRHVAFVSKFLQEQAEAKGFRAGKSFIISRGFDLPLGWDVDRPKADPPRFFMACQINPLKGVHHAVEAAGLLQRRRPDLRWRLEMAGVSYSGYQQLVERLVQKEGLKDRVHFLGQIPRSQVLEKMRSSAAFLSCSTWGEPFAGTIIETLATGTTLIGARAGSILEVATPEKSALIYEIGDTETLSRHMERVLGHPGFARQLAAEGVKVVQQRYTLGHILDRTESAFCEILGQSIETFQSAPRRP